MARAPRIVVPWPALEVNVLKSILIDLIQGHRKYYAATGHSVYGSILLPENARCEMDGGRVLKGFLVDLDSLRPSDPILLASASISPDYKATIADFPRPRIYEQRENPAADCVSELGSLIRIMCAYLHAAAGGRMINAVATVWEELGPYDSRFLPIVDTWLKPMWRLATNLLFLNKRRVHAGLLECPTYENLLAIIVRDVGAPELAFRAALHVPLPLPPPAELAVKPAFQCLLHIPTTADFKRAAVDIVNTIVEFSDKPLCFPAITPDRLLFQQHSLSTASPLGFVLDLDPLDAPHSLSECTDAHHDTFAIQFAAYDLISGPALPPLLPRHALEAFFNALVWIYVVKQFAVPYMNTWLDPEVRLRTDRASSSYQAFVDSRRAFLREGAVLLDAAIEGNGRTDEMSKEVRDAWLEPLWAMIGEAHFCARWREGEEGFDWGTLGGLFTVQQFMMVLVPGSEA